MGVPIEDLVSESANESADYAYLLQYVRNAKPAELARLNRELAARCPARPSLIALIGLRGAGKSTIGSAIAAQLGWPFTELVRTIEQRAGMSVNEIFSLGGQSTYRRFERQCLEESIESVEPGIIAVGGSLVSEPSSYERLLSSCVTIWLHASPEDHMNRVIAQGDSRPMAGNARAMEDLKRILNERESLYRRADYIVDTSGARVVDTINEILGLPAVTEFVTVKGVAYT
jgi:XRE family aerobic/anaerobic benzoate catabolism transcriptional regulator